LTNAISPEGAILLVDANPEVAALISEVVRTLPWNVETVANNDAALALIKIRRFEIVITSEKTCAQEDIDLLRRIRRVHPHTRVIILTPAGTPSGVVSAMRENAFSFFSAPLALDQLKALLQTALDTPPWDDGIELESATPAWIRLFARCDHATADRLVQFINEIGADLPLDERTDLSAAFREMLLNAMEHGGRFDPNEYIEISYLRSERAISCRIRDPGKGFSLNDIPHSAVSHPPETPWAHIAHREAQGLRPGGFGILLARNFVDEVIYNEKGNEVILIRYVDRGRSRDSASRAGI
jgi:anti-sigma regulatory factor (Ser/Thr protein kinase)/CheY-like chemotaxis protein